MEKIIKTTRLQILLIVIATVLVYINSLGNGLVWDDHLFIEKWKEMQNFDIVSLVKGSAPQAQGRLYRPLRSIIYAIDYKLWGQNPFFYHLQAILIHLGATVLVFYIVRLLVSKDMSLRRAKKQSLSPVIASGSEAISMRSGIASSSLDKLGTPRNDKSGIPLIAALLFGLHPIHTETIDYISASLETFGSLFFFLAFYLFLKKKYIVSTLVSGLAFFTYEMTLTLPLLIFLYDYIFRSSANFKFQISNFKFSRYLPYFALAFFYVFVRIFVFGIVARTEYLAYSFYHTMLTMVKVFAHYILLLFLPFNLTTNHRLVGDFPSSMLPYDKLDPILKQSIFDKEILLGILGILGILGLAIKLYRKYPLVTFCIGWFFIALLPVSYIIPHGGAMAEKYLYIASFGFVVIVGVLALVISNLSLSKVRNPLRHSKTGGDLSPRQMTGLEMTAVLLLALFYVFLTFQRNTVWRNDITLFTDMERKAANNLLATYTLGVLYGERNHFDIASSYYQKAINKAPDFWEAHYNLGNIYARVGKNDLAKREYEKVLQINKDFTPAKNNLDLLSRHSGEEPKATTPESLDFSQGKSVGDSGQARISTDFIRYSFNEISLEYPKSWTVKRDKSRVVITDGAFFTIEIMLDKKKDFVSANEYIAQSKESFGKLINQGLAKVPNVDFAYVKVWDTSKLQFFLFKKDLVVKILVYPSSSPDMKQFDTILGSISLNETK